MMPIADEAVLARARAAVEEVERPQHDLPLYVREGCDPSLAVRQIRNYLMRNLNGSLVLALTVVALDRVVDSLEKVSYRFIEVRER